MREAQGGVVWLDGVQAAGFDAPAREDAQQHRLGPQGEGAEDHGGRRARRRPDDALGIWMRHLDAENGNGDAVVQPVREVVPRGLGAQMLVQRFGDVSEERTT